MKHFEPGCNWNSNLQNLHIVYSYSFEEHYNYLAGN